MAARAVPMQTHPRYTSAARDFDDGPLPSISSRDGGFREHFASRPFGIPLNDNLSPSTASTPMAIHGSEGNGINAPPPLPPPRLAPVDGPVDPNVQHYRDSEFMRNDGPNSLESESFKFERRALPNKHENPHDEGYQSFDSVRSSQLSSPFGLHAMKGFRPSTAAIDQTMLNSGFNRAPPLRARRTKSSLMLDDGFLNAEDDEDNDFPMEETTRMRTLKIEDSWRERHRENERETESGSWQRGHKTGSSHYSPSQLYHAGRDMGGERSYYQSGQKRPASPTPIDRCSDTSGLNRGSPTPRLTVVSQGSVSSLSAASRSGSYIGNLTASSIASNSSLGRLSPNGVSPGGVSPTDVMGNGSPYATPISLTASPRSSISRTGAAQSPHPRISGDYTQRSVEQSNRTLGISRKLAEIPKNASNIVAAKLKGPYMCECCPKKPKKFDTEEDLKLHEAEKQYGCSFCGNRFKNKNEAERHQNSLHVRRHSWSCSALQTYDRAFHDSSTRPGEADTCGYCGEEFARTGRNAAGIFASEQDWEDRIRHLQDVHKFRECNASKKFFRADHFRQHLKHSHAGTSGKWTNMLENACMMDEGPAAPR
ncbi:hypothetical protein NEUTE1DRAFT_124168 [Neurospora tetrasperma FGSC 2508]|uniref:C2H2-type domain-containing protein n=1 Tax=Neurospora tetrasperma (strain FGSC 2508 / ATCC MYA-4615 / P0657) TaxID=510951 RepID=F8MS25_NEUT8|nr:uncharacterized protein NEUTE1DRAFT_124168 [Neurospora tetrasperma FGSC 2508]EGO55819.1 hypothetical protein NEUTE1DRAFT_124168 [Neurospora tetrasperma FGSC 2508]EGZ68926.1 hypothetical protein NEUTE2DRAFT_114880 [Neurospora tetrasperma FGSC 2509]